MAAAVCWVASAESQAGLSTSMLHYADASVTLFAGVGFDSDASRSLCWQGTPALLLFSKHRAD